MDTTHMIQEVLIEFIAILIKFISLHLVPARYEDSAFKHSSYLETWTLLGWVAGSLRLAMLHLWINHCATSPLVCIHNYKDNNEVYICTAKYCNIMIHIYTSLYFLTCVQRVGICTYATVHGEAEYLHWPHLHTILLLQFCPVSWPWHGRHWLFCREFHYTH